MFMDVLILCEANLDDDVSDGELKMSNYKVYRKDRSQVTSQKVVEVES